MSNTQKITLKIDYIQRITPNRKLGQLEPPGTLGLRAFTDSSMKYGLGKRILETNRLPWNSDHHLDPEFRIPTDNRARKLDELQMHKKLSLSSVNLPRHLERVVPTIGPGSRMEPIFEQEEDLKVMEKPDGDDKELKTEQEANIDVTMKEEAADKVTNVGRFRLTKVETPEISASNSTEMTGNLKRQLAETEKDMVASKQSPQINGRPDDALKQIANAINQKVKKDLAKKVKRIEELEHENAANQDYLQKVDVEARHKEKKLQEMKREIRELKKITKFQDEMLDVRNKEIERLSRMLPRDSESEVDDNDKVEDETVSSDDDERDKQPKREDLDLIFDDSDN